MKILGVVVACLCFGFGAGIALHRQKVDSVAREAILESQTSPAVFIAYDCDGRPMGWGSNYVVMTRPGLLWKLEEYDCEKGTTVSVVSKEFWVKKDELITTFRRKK